MPVVSPSEAVVLHPSLFVPEGSSESGTRLVRTAAMAAIVGLLERDTADLHLVSLPVLDLFGVGRRLRLTPTDTRHDWPAGSLEEGLQVVVHASVHGVDLAEALRELVTPTGHWRPDVLGFVRRGLSARGHEPPDTEAQAREIAKMLEAWREENPKRWEALQEQVDRGCRPSLRRHAVRAARDPLDPVRRRDGERNFLRSWERLNRDPPSAK